MSSPSFDEPILSFCWSWNPSDTNYAINGGNMYCYPNIVIDVLVKVQDSLHSGPYKRSGEFSIVLENHFCFGQIIYAFQYDPDQRTEAVE